jgi:hypothetical protein
LRDSVAEGRKVGETIKVLINEEKEKEQARARGKVKAEKDGGEETLSKIAVLARTHRCMMTLR